MHGHTSVRIAQFSTVMLFARVHLKARTIYVSCLDHGKVQYSHVNLRKVQCFVLITDVIDTKTCQSLGSEGTKSKNEVRFGFSPGLLKAT